MVLQGLPAAEHRDWSGNPVASGKIGAARQLLSSSQLRTLNRYLLIPKRSIFESSVRDASPNLAADPLLFAQEPCLFHARLPIVLAASVSHRRRLNVVPLDLPSGISTES